MSVTKTTFCAICQTQTSHTISFDDAQDGVIKMTCVNTTDEVEHAIRMSGNVTKEEVVKILADHEQAFKQTQAQKDNQVVAEVSDDQKLTDLFN